MGHICKDHLKRINGLIIINLWKQEYQQPKVQAVLFKMLKKNNFQVHLQ